jgi:hypothetical protein
MPRNFPDHCPPFDLSYQPIDGRGLCLREVLLEQIVGRRPKATKQANPKSAAIMVLNVSLVDFHSELSRFFHREVSHL